MISAIVLAAGKSSRMNLGNKLLLPYRDSTIIRTVVQNILEAHLGEVIVVTGHQEAGVRSALNGMDVKFVSNQDFDSGMTSTIKAGVEGASGTGYMICLSDMPLIKPDDYQLIGKEFEESVRSIPKLICVPGFKGRRGNPVVFSSAYRNEILSHPHPEGCKEIIMDNLTNVHSVEMSSASVLSDIDTQEDYQEEKTSG